MGEIEVSIPLYLIKDILKKEGVEDEEVLKESSRRIKSTLETFDHTGGMECPNCATRGLGYTLSRRDDNPSFMHVRAKCGTCGLTDDFDTDVYYPPGHLPRDTIEAATGYIIVHFNVLTKDWPATDPYDQPNSSFDPGDPSYNMRRQEIERKKIRLQSRQIRDPYRMGSGLGGSSVTGKGIATSMIRRPSYSEVIAKRQRAKKKPVGRPKKRGFNLNREGIVLGVMESEFDGFESASDGDETR